MPEHQATVEAAVSLHQSLLNDYDFMRNLRRTHHTTEHQAEILGRVDQHLKEALWYANLYKAVMESEAIMVAGGFDPVTRTWKKG